MQNIRVIIRNDYKNNSGDKPLYIRTKFLGIKKDISLNIFVSPENWNNKEMTVLEKDCEAVRKNKYIAKQLAKARKIVDDFYFEEKSLSGDEFLRLYKGKNYADGNFDEFIVDTINKKDFAKETSRTYISQITKLQRFKSKILFSDLSYTFVREYESFMLKTLNNSKNTASKSLAMLRTFCNWCREAELIKESPFDKISISKGKGNRERLTEFELQQLESLYEQKALKANQHNVLRYFLFACYTGIRYTDIHNLLNENIYIENDKYYLRTEQHKTKTLISIPLMKKAVDLLPKSFGKNTNVFNVYSNQKSNSNLKKIAKEAGLNKNISFHVARHTFATIAIDNGIPVEIISNILGHTELKTTMIYAKVSDKIKAEWLDKMENKKAGI